MRGLRYFAIEKERPDMKDYRANVVVVMACLDSFNRHLKLL